MKLLRLFFILMIGVMFWGTDALAQGDPWTGKYQIVFDEDDPDVFYFQIVPDNNGSDYIGSGSVGYVITDPVMDYDVEVVSGTGSWEIEELTGPGSGVSVSCGRIWEIQKGEGFPEITVQEGEPISVVKFTATNNTECAVGGCVRVYSNFNDSEGLDECEAFEGGFDNGLVVAGNTSALTGIITNSDNPLTCPCDAPDAPSIAVTQPDCGETTGSVMVNNPLDSVLYTLLKDSVFEASDSSGEFTALTPGEYGILVTEGTCTSDTSFFTINEAAELPVISVSSTGNPAECGGEGTIVLGFTGVEDGSYDIEYDGGVFEDIDVADNSASISAPAGAYQNLTITVDGCTSADGVNASLSDPDAPEAPVATVTHADCDVATGSIVVDEPVEDAEYTLSGEGVNVSNDMGDFQDLAPGEYSMTVTISGCTSAASEYTVNPQPAMTAAPEIAVTQPDCEESSGSVEVENPVENTEYTLTGDGVDETNETGLFSDLAPGTSNPTAITE